MNEIAEGLGAAVEGGLVARAVEPKRGEGEALAEDYAAHECANCGTSFSGNYCPNCGQKAHTHRTLTAIGHDLIHGVLHLDGKLSKTLPLLAFKPGHLTRRYIEGERAKFVSPMSMFLFSVFAMFAVFQMVGLTTPTDLNLEETVKGQASKQAEQLRDQIANLPEGDPGRIEAEEGLEQVERYLETGEVGTIEMGTNGAEQTGLPFDLRDLELNVTGIESLDKGIIKKWQENPGLMLYKLQANAYKFSWLLIPLSIPFVWLTFAWRRRFKAYDHAVFVTYSLAFFSLLFIVVSLMTLNPSLGVFAGLMVVFIPPIHLYKQLRGAYGLGRFSAFWRLMVISLFIWIVIALFLQVLLFLGAF